MKCCNFEVGMKLKGLGQYKSLHDLISGKIKAYASNPTQFSTLFDLMFSERENVIAEVSVGYKIKQTTYGEARKNALCLGAWLEGALGSYPKNSLIGLDMSNSLGWIECFWAILLAGYKPLLINSRLPHDVLEGVIADYNVRAIISDSAIFSGCQTIAADKLVYEQTDREVDSFTLGTEVMFMSSGTQGEVKLCAYTAERFYYQICDTYYIVKDCPQIRKGHEGHIKQLALLPFYHVFGFMAVYLWFGFFSRTFVFLKDLSPQTLLNTARRHKVTHVFAVPMVWETIYASAMREVAARGEKTAAKVQKGLKIAKSGRLGKLITHRAFGEIREKIFGDSIKFLISGGSSISREAVEFLNAIGYHLANGYGMTEIGITSVELSLCDKKRNTLSIGKPFRHAEYKAENGELFVRSSTRATRILHKGQETVTNFDEWFKTCDLAHENDGSWFIEGRKDDLIISRTGENLNPNIIEGLFRIDGASQLCLFKAGDGVTTLIISCPKAYTKELAQKIRSEAEEQVKANRLENEVGRILLTTSSLTDENDFKISRKKVSVRYGKGAYSLLTDESFAEGAVSEVQITLRKIFADVLQKDEAEIGVDESFFLSLGGNSLDYFTLIGKIKEETGVTIPIEETQKLSTVRSIEEYILRRGL